MFPVDNVDDVLQTSMFPIANGNDDDDGNLIVIFSGQSSDLVETVSAL